MENLDNQQKELAWTDQIELKKKKEKKGIPVRTLCWCLKINLCSWASKVVGVVFSILSSINYSPPHFKQNPHNTQIY